MRPPWRRVAHWVRRPERSPTRTGIGAARNRYRCSPTCAVAYESPSPKRGEAPHRSAIDSAACAAPIVGTPAYMVARRINRARQIVVLGTVDPRVGHARLRIHLDPHGEYPYNEASIGVLRRAVPTRVGRLHPTAMHKIAPSGVRQHPIRSHAPSIPVHACPSLSGCPSASTSPRRDPPSTARPLATPTIHTVRARAPTTERLD